MPRLLVQSLSKRFGERLVLDNLSFEADSGVLGIAGYNGSGKTTLLRCLSGLMRAGKGSVTWSLNNAAIPPDKLRDHIGFAGPWLQLYREMSCLENLLFLGDLRRIPDARARAEKLLSECGLTASANTAYGRLSSGQQQRMKLASALIHHPDFLLLDEPGSNLDEAGRSFVQHIIHAQQQRNGLTILASNDPAELDLCTHIVRIGR